MFPLVIPWSPLSLFFLPTSHAFAANLNHASAVAGLLTVQPIGPAPLVSRLEVQLQHSEANVGFDGKFWW